MLFRNLAMAAVVAFGVAVCSQVQAADLELGDVKLDHAGPLTFGPNGILFVGDPIAAAVYAIDTGDTTGKPEETSINVKGIGAKVAGAVGAKANEVLINDLAVNPLTGTAFLSVMRGKGPKANAIILKVDGKGKLSELKLKGVKFAKAALPNAPGKDAKDRRGRPQRRVSITDLAFVNNQVVVAGLTNEDFASNLRAIPYPFQKTPSGVSVEIYHGAHGKYETRSPVRTFAPIMVENKPYVVAAYTCTPLVRFPLSALESKEEKVRGTTVAELGNRNVPLDMIVYKKDGQQVILMSNSARGVMKITTKDITRKEGITERVRGKAGQKYDTIESLKNVVQLDKLNSKNALVLVKNDGAFDLKTVDLP